MRHLTEKEQKLWHQVVPKLRRKSDIERRLNRDKRLILLAYRVWALKNKVQDDPPNWMQKRWRKRNSWGRFVEGGE